jgi:hypothetical protein
MANLDNIDWEIKKLSLAPGDIVVFSCDMSLSLEQVNEVRLRLRAYLGERETIVLTMGTKLSTLTRAEIEALIC